MTKSIIRPNHEHIEYSATIFHERRGSMKKSLSPIIFLIILVLAGVTIYAFKPSKGERRALSGLEEPVQSKLKKEDGTGTSFEKAGYDVTVNYLYKYEVDALVLSTKDYKGLGIQDSLSPKDIGVAWGKVAENNLAIDFQWSQSNRFLNWYVDDINVLAPVGGPDGVTQSCSNNHIIPADDNVKSQLKKVKMGDHVQIEGYLISLNGVDSKGHTFTWNSSTSRTDSGDGACEVIYATKISVVGN